MRIQADQEVWCGRLVLQKWSRGDSVSLCWLRFLTKLCIFFKHLFLGLAQPCYPLFISILFQLKKSKFLSQSSLGGNHFLRDKMNTKIITAKSSKTMHVEECVGLVNHWTCISISTGLLTSITLPCYYQGKFIGVVGTDISMEDLLSEITYFQRGQSSYAFMVDSSGRTMMHPLLPAPSDAFGDPIFIEKDVFSSCHERGTAMSKA